MPDYQQQDPYYQAVSYDDHSAQQYGYNYEAVEFPVMPNGMPYSKEDYLALSQDYQNARYKIRRTGIIMIVIGVIILLVGLIVGVVISTTGLKRVIPGLIIGFVFGILGATLGADGESGSERKIKIWVKNTIDIIYRTFITVINDNELSQSRICFYTSVQNRKKELSRSIP